MSADGAGRLNAEWTSLGRDLVEYFADEGGMVFLPVVGPYDEVGEAFLSLLRGAMPPALDVRVFALTDARTEPLTELAGRAQPHLQVTVVIGLETLEPTTRRRALAALNRRRQMFRYLRAKLVLWIDPALVADVDFYAADLLDWRTRLLELPARPPTSAPDQSSIDVFISYAGPDRAIATALHGALYAVGLQPWCDAVDLVPGDLWDEAIPRALRRSRGMVVLITPSWPLTGDIGAEWYGPKEVAFALRSMRAESRPIIPISLDGAGTERTPYSLIRYVPLVGRTSDLAPIAERIRHALRSIEPTATPPRDPLAAAETRRAALMSTGAPPEALAAVDARILAIKRGRLHARGPEAGLILAGRWHLISRLGRGGFAEVWEAWDEQRATLVAVKLLHAQFDDSAERRARFFRGARQMARLDHPHIVEIIAPEVVDGGRHFFVMELLAGGDLDAAIRGARIARDDALVGLVGVSEAVGLAHTTGLVHRDVKPSNILLTAEGRMKLTDFDLVRAAADTTGGTRTGALGTFIYAAPESMESANTANASADVYGLGMCVFFVLLGKALPRRILRDPDRVIAQVEGFGAVTALVRRAIDWEPDARPADGYAFARDLQDALAADLGIEIDRGSA